MADDGSVVRLSRAQPQVGLALLVLERHRPVARDELAHVLWGDELSPHWPGAARGVITRVRDALDAAGLPRTTLTTVGGHVHLRLPPGAVVDVEEAREAVDAADRAARAGDAAAAVALVEPAVAVLAQRFLPGIDLPWVDLRRHEVEGLERRAVRILAEGLLGSGRAGEAVRPVRELLTVDPYDEQVHRLLVRALVEAGDRVGARQAIDACRATLRAELGVAPSRETTESWEALLARDAGAAPNVGSPVPPTAPPADPIRATGSAVASRPRPPTPSGTFVGRRREHGLVRDEVLRPPGSGVAPDGLRVVVLEGEAGVGKTRLAHEVADDAEAAGIRVLWGRCGPDGGLPYEPVVEALAAVVAAEAAGDRDLDLRELRADLAPLLPGGGPATTEAGGPSGPLDRGRLFRAAAAAIGRFASEPVLWVVDDLQWASADTLALLGYLGAELRTEPITLLATARERPEPVAAMLAHLARQTPLRVVPLGGLAVDDVGRWLAASSIDAPSDVVADVHDRTGGNPLYVGHLLRAAVEGGGDLDPSVVPVELQSFLDQQVASQPPDAVLVLAAAAVHGSVIGFEVLQAVTGLGDRELFAAVDQVVATRLLVEDPGGAGLRFSHALVRDAVLAGIGPSRRAWYHQRLAEALEPGGPRLGLAAELARHHAAAGPAWTEAARHWTIQAASEALDQAAWEAAAAHADRALTGVGADPDDRILALVARGRACRGLGDRPGTFAALEEAAALARLHDRPRRLAESVLALVGGGGRGVPDHARHRWVSLIEEALAGLGDGDEDLRVPLLGSLALALLLTDRDADREASAEEARRVALASGDPFLVAQALLDHRQARVGPEHTEERLADLDRVLAVTLDSSHLGLAVAASIYQHEDRLLIGDRVGARASLERAEALLERHPDPFWRWCAATWRVLDLILFGDLDAAEQAAFAALDGVGPEPGEEAVACFGVNLVDIRLFQGRAGEVVDLLAAAADDHPEIPCYRAVLALCLAEAGDLDGARAAFEFFAGARFANIPDDTNRLLAFAVLADVARQLHAVDAAPALLEELGPHAGRQVVLNCFGGGGASWGPVTALLAGLARLTGDGAAAEHWERQARVEATTFGAPLVLARLDRVLGAPADVR